MNMKKINESLNTLTIENTTPEQLSKIIDTLSGKEMELEINKRQQKIDEANTLRIQSETKIAGYRESYSEIIKELQSMEIDPKNINLELLNLCKEIAQITAEIDDLMPDIEKIKEIQNPTQNIPNDVGF